MDIVEKKDETKIIEVPVLMIKVNIIDFSNFKRIFTSDEYQDRCKRRYTNSENINNQVLQ